MEKYNVTTEFVGGSLVGYVTTSYDALVSLFGEPASSDDYKVSSEWTIRGPGCLFTIYDYKETDLYDSDLPSVEEFRALPSYEWHIGGNITQKQIFDFRVWLSEKLEEK